MSPLPIFTKIIRKVSERLVPGNRGCETLSVEDVMRTLSYTYWTNVILQNHHFLTPFSTLFRQNFFRFFDFLIFFERILIKIRCVVCILNRRWRVRCHWKRHLVPDLWKRNVLIGPRLLFETLSWWIAIAHNMAKQKIVIFFVNTNVKAIIAMMMSLIKWFSLV